MSTLTWIEVLWLCSALLGAGIECGLVKHYWQRQRSARAHFLTPALVRRARGQLHQRLLLLAVKLVLLSLAGYHLSVADYPTTDWEHWLLDTSQIGFLISSICLALEAGGVKYRVWKMEKEKI